MGKTLSLSETMLVSARLRSKSALVTGGTSGIGRKIVELFRAHGASVVFTGRNMERGHEVEAQTGAKFICADATADNHAELVVAEAIRMHGRIDILVNNAGRPRSSTIETITADEFDATVDVNLRAPLLLISRVIPEMRRSESGSIINICSVAAHRVGAEVAYSVSKAGLLHLTRCIAGEVGRYGIRV